MPQEKPKISQRASWLNSWENGNVIIISAFLIPHLARGFYFRDFETCWEMFIYIYNVHLLDKRTRAIQRSFHTTRSFVTTDFISSRAKQPCGAARNLFLLKTEIKTLGFCATCRPEQKGEDFSAHLSFREGTRRSKQKAHQFTKRGDWWTISLLTSREI
jgi:hypothetical protein